MAQNHDNAEDDMSQKSDNSLTWFSHGMHLLIPFVIVAIGGLIAWIQKLDDRLYEMPNEYISKNDFNVALTRIEATLDSRITAMEKNQQERQEEASAQMERLIERVGKVDDKLNELTVDVEKKLKR